MSNNKKISELVALTTAQDADVIPIVNGGSTKKITKANFLKEITQSLAEDFYTKTEIDGFGFLTEETDPIFLASQAFNIDEDDITNLGNLSGVNTGDQDLEATLTQGNDAGGYEMAGLGISELLKIGEKSMSGDTGWAGIGFSDGSPSSWERGYLVDTETGKLRMFNDGEYFSYFDHSLGGNDTNRPITVRTYDPGYRASYNLIDGLNSGYMSLDESGNLIFNDGISGEKTLAELLDSGPVDSVNGETGAVVLDTDDIGEGATNLYFTEARVLNTLLAGLSVSGGSIVSTDTILQAFGKTQNQINALLGGVSYQGTWDADLNDPTLTSGVGTKGYYYVVDTPGSTNLDGITDWKLGDWAIYNGVTWEKVDNTDAVISVNGQTGAVSLTTTDIAEGTNLYYTDARFDTRLGTKTTSNLTEGSNLYYTDARARASISAIGPLAYSDSTGIMTTSMATNKLIGRGSASTGVMEEITLGHQLSLSSLTLNATPNIALPARVATTVALTVTYSNGSSGVGATLTNAGAQAVLAIDGSTLSVGDRVLVKNQASTFQNGIYLVTNVGSGSTNWIMTRATDFDGSAGGQITYGAQITIVEGTANAGVIYIQLTSGTITVGTTDITFLGNSALSGGSLSGGGALNQLAFWNGASSLSGNDKAKLTLGASTDTVLELHSTGGASDYARYYGYGHANGYGGLFTGLSSNGTQASPTLASLNNYLVVLSGFGYTGTQYAGGGQLQFRIRGGTPSSTSMPTSMLLYLTPVGSLTQNLVGSCDGGGRWGFGSISDPLTTSRVEIGAGYTYHLAMTNGSTQARFAVGANTTTFSLGGASTPLLDITTSTEIVTSASSRIALIVKGASSQSANLQEWQNSSSTVLASVDANGLGLFAGLSITDAKDITIGTSTGSKIGQASSKIGFFGATPVAQQASVADATGGVVIDAEARTAINALISRIEALGLIVTV